MSTSEKIGFEPQCARAVGLCIGAHCGKRVLYAAFSFSEPLNELTNGL